MIIGHKDIIEKLNRLISNNEVAHSYIFSGQDGIGKLLIAKDFAENILCKDNEKEQIMFDNNNHPDFKLLIPDEKGTIKAYLTKVYPINDEPHSFGALILALTEAHRNGITEAQKTHRLYFERENAIR